MTTVSYTLIISALLLTIVFNMTYAIVDEDKIACAYLATGCTGIVLVIVLLCILVTRCDTLQGLKNTTKITDAYTSTLCLMNKSDTDKTYIVSKETVLISNISEYTLKPNECIYKTSMTGGYKVLLEK